MLEHEDLLGGGLVVGSRSNSNNGAGSDVGELELESEGPEGLTRVVSELELVGVLVELEDLEDLGADVEVGGLLGSLLEVHAVVSTNVGGAEEGVGPLSEGLLDGHILLLEGRSLSGEGVRGISGNALTKRRGLVGGVESP